MHADPSTLASRLSQSIILEEYHHSPNHPWVVPELMQFTLVYGSAGARVG
jgi:hypothetical protein